MHWNLPVELTTTEEKLCNRLRRSGRFYSFLRQARHALFDEGLQAELAAMYAEDPRGMPAIPPALVCAVLLLQAYAKVSDAEAIRRVHMDLAWRMVLGWLDTADEDIKVCQGTLFNVRMRLMRTGMDKVLLARTVTLAKETGAFGTGALKGLRIAMDSAPLEGAGKVEDTINLLGRALRHVVRAIATLMDRGVEAVAADAGVVVLLAKSTKAALDLDWNEEDASIRALDTLLSQVTALKTWLSQQSDVIRLHETVHSALATLDRVIQQDTELDPTRSGRRIKEGVAVDRQISLSDPEMRHGRKSQSQRIDGYKRFISSDVDHDLVLAVAVQPANQGEHHGADAMRAEVEQHGPIEQVQIDRAFLASQLVKDLDARDGEVLAKSYPDQGKPGYTKYDFIIDEAAGTVTCPAGQTTAIRSDRMAKFPNAICAVCTQRPQCQKSGAQSGRSIQVHPQQALLKKLRAGTKTPEGRARLRERVVIEHNLAHAVFRQGNRSRYFGVRKNEYDLRRSAIILNLHAIDRRADIGSWEPAAAA
jgi:hypothetical protein